MKRLIVLLIPLLLAVAACAQRTAPAPGPPPTARGDALARGVWTASGATYLLHHTGRVEIGAKRIPMTGVLLLDTCARTARVQAIGAFGLTLFAIEITPREMRRLGACPLFERFPSWERHATLTVRALFLAPVPGPGDGCREEGPRVLLSGHREGGLLASTFDAATGDLSQTAFKGPDADWSATYSDQRPVGGTRIPYTVRFDDAATGYAVELTLQDLEIR